MRTLLEDPMPIIFVGIVAEAVLGAIFLSTRRGVFLLAMAGVLVLVLLGVLIERVVVTEVERVEATLDSVAAALEANNIDGVLRHISSSATQTRRRAEWALGRIEVLDINIRNLEVTINELTSPPTATADFDINIRYNDRKGEWPYHSYFCSFGVELRLECDRWMIAEHTEEHPYGRP